MEQDLREEGAARARHVVHVLPPDDVRVSDVVRTLVERLATDTEGPGLRLLVLTPSAGEAARFAALVNDGLDASGPLLIPVTDLSRGARRLTVGAVAVVTTPEVARALIAKSALKLDAVEALALLQLDELVGASGNVLEEVVSESARGADRIATAAAMTPAVDAFLERHARKARRMTYDLGTPSDAATEYLVCDAAQRADALASLLDTLNPPHATVVASEDDAEAACAALAQLGYGPDDELVSFSDGACPQGEPLVVLFTTPAEPGDLAELVTAEPARIVVLVAPEDLAGFRRVFGKGARPVNLASVAAPAETAVDRLRAEVRRELEVGGLHHHVLALAPLFAEYAPAEVAAATLRLHEAAGAGAPVAAPARAPVSREALDSGATHPRRTQPIAASTPAPRAASGDFTSLFITIGEKDGARKGDLVGAISNEAGISSELLGKITMRDTFSIVEVDSSVAARVIEALNGKTIRGRVAAVREDRGPERKEGERPRRSGFGAGAGARGHGGDRPRRSSRDDRGARGDDRPRGRGGFGAARGTGRPAREGDRPHRTSRDEVRGPRTFRDGDRGRTPRAMDESREWRDRGEQLRHARRPRRGDG